MEQIFWNVIALYLIAMNLAGFLSMKVDKERARKKKWRIKERTLFLIALLGGSLGSLLGMRIFHHKTKHWYFVVGIPVILILQIILAGILLKAEKPAMASIGASFSTVKYIEPGGRRYSSDVKELVLWECGLSNDISGNAGR